MLTGLGCVRFSGTKCVLVVLVSASLATLASIAWLLSVFKPVCMESVEHLTHVSVKLDGLMPIVLRPFVVRVCVHAFQLVPPSA